MQLDITNIAFRQAGAFVRQTNKSLFLNGRAGTGKTTFLRYIREHCFKKMAVVAPTGVAAINAGGVTIHSFFQLPFGMYIPEYPQAWGEAESLFYNRNQLLGKLRLSSPKRELMRELDLLIIDEVSMLRADLLDAIDTVLRAVRRRYEEPFGGVQVLYIGDLFQLPPVVKKEEWKMFSEFYRSAFFFSAKVINEAPPVYLTLKKIYRQSDPVFINLLNNIRNNCCTAADISRLHEHYKPGYLPSREEGYITLTSHNYMADEINRIQLNRLPGKAYHFEAAIKGEFSSNAYPVSQVLVLKEGAQVMFVKNDKGEDRRYYNGKIGIVQRIEKKTDEIFVSFPEEEGILKLSLETWRNIRYKYDQEADDIIEEELGTFTQFPIRLAWAVTIHKSQGLTFNKAIIDAGASFAPGQVYVALSRLTSLDGLILRSAITPQSIMTDEQVVAFSAGEQPDDALNEKLEAAQQEFLRLSLLDAFDWKKVLAKADQVLQYARQRTIPDKPTEIPLLIALKETILQQYTVAEKFKVQLDNLLINNNNQSQMRLHQRAIKAVDWFSEALRQKCIKLLEDQIAQVKKKSRTKKYVKLLQELLLVFIRKDQQILQTTAITEALLRSSQMDELMECVAQMQRPSEVALPEEPAPERKREKGETFRISLQLFKEGMSIEEIAATRGLKQGTIENHLLKFIPAGEIAIKDIVSPEKISRILHWFEKYPNTTPSGIKNALGDTVSYMEIRGVMLYMERMKRLSKEEIKK